MDVLTLRHTQNVHLVKNFRVKKKYRKEPRKAYFPEADVQVENPASSGVAAAQCHQQHKTSKPVRGRVRSILPHCFKNDCDLLQRTF